MDKITVNNAMLNLLTMFGFRGQAAERRCGAPGTAQM